MRSKERFYTCQTDGSTGRKPEKRKGAGAEGEAKDRRPYIRTKAGRGGVRGKAGTSFFKKQQQQKKN